MARCYSLASSPYSDVDPKVTVKRTVDGYGSNWLCDNVCVGGTIEVLPPAGVFTPTHLGHDFLLWAAGSGITPVMSILKSVLVAGTGRVTPIYANRDERSVIFADELRWLADRSNLSRSGAHQHTITRHAGPVGRPTSAHHSHRRFEFGQAPLGQPYHRTDVGHHFGARQITETNAVGV